MTSSPSRTPTARSARCSPAVPLETALASGAPTHAAKRCSKSPSSGPSESRPERSTRSDRVLLGLAEDGLRERDLVLRGALTPAARPACRARASRRALPGGRDDVLGDADRAPHLASPSEASSSTRVTAPVPLFSSRMRTLKLTSSMSARCGWTSPIAARSARSSALTGPLPSAICTRRSPSIQILIVASVCTSPSARCSTITRQDSSVKSGS